MVFGRTISLSTNTYFYDKISSAIDNKEFTVGIFIDFSKAFDNVIHENLLGKRHYYGVAPHRIV